MRNLQSLRLLLADKDKEIERLKKELKKEKQAYINMYNMYVEKDNIIKKAIDYLMESSETEEDLKNDEIYGGGLVDLLHILQGK